MAGAQSPLGREVAGAAPARRERIGWADAARGIGIATVFFGHYLQDLAPHDLVASDDLRFLYSFHVPFFFVLSGCFAHREPSFWKQLKVLAMRRLLPVLFFGICFGLLDTVARLRHGNIDADWIEEMIGDYLMGRPLLDWVTWFLVCLFVCELLAYFIVDRLRTPFEQFATGVLLILIGATFGNRTNHSSEGIAFYFGEFWFFSEAIVAVGFYLVGHTLRPWLTENLNSAHRASLVMVSGFLLVLVTFQRNTIAGEPVVVMMASRSHGNVIWFCVTALAGSLALLGAGALLSSWKLLQKIGRNTVPLLGLNGLFFGGLNQLAIRHIHDPTSRAGVALVAAGVTIASLLLCAPLVTLLRNLVPQLIGNPRKSGPLLPALE